MADQTFWPNGAQLAITISLMFEGGGQPLSGQPGPLSGFPMKPGYIDYVTNSYYEYGPREGIPRLLDLYDKHTIKVTSFMIGQAIEKMPEVAKEVAARGHECAAHGRAWVPQYDMSYGEERQFIFDNVMSIEQITGQRPIGYNCNAMRDSDMTLKILQELGFTYHIDDVSRDNPFVIQVNNAPFAVVPYTMRNNDLLDYEFFHVAPQSYEQRLHDEFDQLYAEGANRQRMMVISCHDRAAGQPAHVRVLDRFIEYAKGFQGVWFARKDEIAQWTLETSKHA